MNLLLTYVFVVGLSLALSKKVGTLEHTVPNTDVVEFVETELNSASNSIYYWKVTRVVKAKKQVVQGLLHRITFIVSPTICSKRKWNGTKLARCPVDRANSPQLCKADIWQRSWLNPPMILQSHSCVKLNNSNTLGGEGEDLSSFVSFLAFKEKFNKTYANHTEFQKRFQIFRSNMQKAMELQRYEQGTAKYGVTKFADMSAAEFRKFFLSPTWQRPAYEMRQAEIDDNVTIPTAWDWRTKNAVTPVKNQGYCGSCWAFSTTGNVEGIWAVKKKQLISLSEQELVDCDKVDEGCNGGLPSNAYREIIRLGGLEAESKYPYDGSGDTCKYQKKNVRVYINDSVALPTDEGKMAVWLYTNGPISIGINANLMQFYMWGISHPWWSWLCRPSGIDHGVLIVGYGFEGAKNKPFWIVKNSWGENWGENGYYRVYRGDGTCGLNQMATSAIVD